jgi:alpha-1,2-mannosyltransferase
VARYGTEPWYWYILNGFVNMGLAWPFVLAAPAVSLLAAGRPFTLKKSCNLLVGKGPIALAPALWTLFLSLLPHKEERFLAVIFPIACFTAADCVSQLFDVVTRLSPRLLKPLLPFALALFTALAMLLGALRCAASVSNYGASLAIWATVSSLHTPPGTVVCVGKEWQDGRYRRSRASPHVRGTPHCRTAGTGFTRLSLCPAVLPWAICSPRSRASCLKRLPHVTILSLLL